ncbi:RNA polymerase sigma factor [Roseateles oligotrophus]|uniref:RNA polymerase sigma factor n=1 Tax=Roseateles oligotrophus TaxID=1769250 RepID=A0ABT2YM66_9BURK|nr:RNA polymerase sigma factor [Roseateles oligotrophus]MCV2371097.1 RNA polymerase sigma factor [Roseateles oligotrophus]
MPTNQPFPTGSSLSVESSVDSPDSVLISLSLSGDEKAFALIMRRYNRLLFRTARSILKNDDDTQDAVQEAYLRAWRALASFRADAKLSTWLVRIAANEALGRLRQTGAQVWPLNATFDSDGESLEVQMEANPDEQPEATTMRGQLRRQIEARIDSLPDQFRTVFMLRGVEELSVEEVAEVLEIPEATVRSRFFRARGLLREGLARDTDMAVADAFSFAGPRCDKIVAGVLAAIARERASR